jgi:hypothetical protein
MTYAWGSSHSLIYLKRHVRTTNELTINWQISCMSFGPIKNSIVARSWDFHGGEDVFFWVLAPCRLSPEDGDSMFLQNDIYLRVNTAPKHRTTSRLLLLILITKSDANIFMWPAICDQNEHTKPSLDSLMSLKVPALEWGMSFHNRSSIPSQLHLTTCHVCYHSDVDYVKHHVNGIPSLGTLAVNSTNCNGTIIIISICDDYWFVFWDIVPCSLVETDWPPHPFVLPSFGLVQPTPISKHTLDCMAYSLNW